MTTQTVEPQTTKPAAPSDDDEGTQVLLSWSEPSGRAVDLMGVLDEGAAQAQTAADGFNAVFAWARTQDFPPDHAERMRQEAWGTQPE